LFPSESLRAAVDVSEPGLQSTLLGGREKILIQRIFDDAIPHSSVVRTTVLMFNNIMIATGGVGGVVGIEGGVSGVINLESSGVGASDSRPRICSTAQGSSPQGLARVSPAILNRRLTY
jgi:hypothetical protein